LSLLGAPRLRRDDQILIFRTRKAAALLAYLAVEERPHSRARLIALLWPGSDEPHGRHLTLTQLSLFPYASEVANTCRSVHSAPSR
jgi:DNA-binding SARP family transcriptional activator